MHSTCARMHIWRIGHRQQQPTATSGTGAAAYRAMCICAYASEEYAHTGERPLYGAARERARREGCRRGECDEYTLGCFDGTACLRVAFVLAHSSASHCEGEGEGGG